MMLRTANVLAMALALLPSGLSAQQHRHHELPGKEIRHGWVNRAEPARAALLSQAMGSTTASATVVQGDLRLPVIFVQFSNESLRHSPALLAERMFGSPTGLVSARQFYDQMSGGKLRVSGGFAQTHVQLTGTSQWYVGNRGTNGVAQRLDVFLQEVMSRAVTMFDWRLYDNDGRDNQANSGDDDGRVDTVVIVYATEDGSCSETNNGRMWAHRWNMTDATGRAFETPVRTPDGRKVVIDDYIMVPALDCNGTTPAAAGLLIHEIGHVLGLPDLYPTNAIASEGAGFWDVMASGNWRTEQYPTAMGAWSRAMLGWVNVQDVNERINLAIPPVHDSLKVVRVPSPSSDDFLLLEYRTSTAAADRYIPGEGLVIWQIDPARVAAHARTNTINNDPARPGIAVVQADGRRDLEEGRNRGDNSDVWPGSLGRFTFSHQTTPAAVSLGTKVALGMRLDDIRVESGLVRLDVTAGLERRSTLTLRANVPGTQARINDTLTVTLPHTSEWLAGQTVRFRILSDERNGSRNRFVRWQDGVTQNERSVIVEGRGASVIDAEVVREHHVRLAVHDPALGSVAAVRGTNLLSLPAWVADGTSIRLASEPASSQYSFLFWQGVVHDIADRDVTFLPPDARLAVTGPVDITAVFTPPMPARLHVGDALLASAGSVPEPILMFLDAIGNRNGRLDVGDVMIGIRAGHLVVEHGRIRIAHEETP
jgi:M6 family metalloprotease-like protein